MAKYNNQSTLALMKQLNQQDIDICCSIYDYQFLTKKLIGFKYYKSDIERDFSSEELKRLKRDLNRLKELGVVEEDKNHSAVLYLTTAGVNVVREANDLQPNVITTSNQILEKNYYRASKLRPKPHFLKRQGFLNETVILIENHLLKASGGAKIDFKSKHQNHKEHSYEYKYIDQRHLANYYPYLDTLKPHGAFIVNESMINSIMVLEDHLVKELSIKALLNKYVKPHLELKQASNKEGLSETLYLLVKNDNQKLSAEPFLMRVKKDYEIENFKIVLVTQFELFENIGEQVSGFIG